MDSSQFDLSSLSDEQRAQLEERLKNMSPQELAQLQAQQCIFCQIIAGKIETKKLYEDENSVVILDINPAALGHLLVLPKQHLSILPQLADELLAHLFLVSRAVSQVLLKAIRGTGGTNIFIANGQVAGQRAQHFMIHIIPRKDDDFVFSFKENITELAKREEFAALIRSQVSALFKHTTSAAGMSTLETSPTTEQQKTLDSQDDSSSQKSSTVNLDTVGKVVSIASDAISAVKEGAELLGLKDDQILLKEVDSDEDDGMSSSAALATNTNSAKKRSKKDTAKTTTKKKTSKNKGTAKKKNSVQGAADDLADLL